MLTSIARIVAGIVAVATLARVAIWLVWPLILRQWPARFPPLRPNPSPKSDQFHGETECLPTRVAEFERTRKSAAMTAGDLDVARSALIVAGMVAAAALVWFAVWL